MEPRTSPFENMYREPLFRRMRSKSNRVFRDVLYHLLTKEEESFIPALSRQYSALEDIDSNHKEKTKIRLIERYKSLITRNQREN